MEVMMRKRVDMLLPYDVDENMLGKVCDAIDDADGCKDNSCATCPFDNINAYNALKEAVNE